VWERETAPLDVVMKASTPISSGCEGEEESRKAAESRIG